MLFEVFFNSTGKLRDDIKSGYFDELFELQRYAELKDSFNFIAEAFRRLTAPSTHCPERVTTSRSVSPLRKSRMAIA